MKSLSKIRSSAFSRQSGRCFYCGYPMWTDSPEHYAKQHGCTPKQAKPLQCTAEHLVARQDGGKDKASNIVAACRACNQRRHQRKQAPAPERYSALVRSRVQKGGWHPFRPGTV